MNRTKPTPDSSWESDAVWKLLDQAPPVTASPRFVDETVRAARLDAKETRWWSRLFFSPAPLAGLAAGAAAVTFTFISMMGTTPEADWHLAELDSHAYAIQEIAETETLIAALDQLDDFSDDELVSLIGF
jgi:hypothetical protein